MLCPSPASRICDEQGRPYFLWDNNVTYDELLEHLASNDDDRRAYWLAKIMRQAKPDDALTISSADEMRRLWPRIERALGQTRAFWAWYLDWTR